MNYMKDLKRGNMRTDESTKDLQKEEFENTCEICNKPVLPFSANSNDWPLRLPFKNGNDKMKLYHMGCVTNALDTVRIKNTITKDSWKNISTLTHSKNVLFKVRVDYHVDGIPYHKYYMMEGSKYDNKYYNWIGDELEDSETVVCYMEIDELYNLSNEE